MAEDSEDKTEEPSGRKLAEARDRGQMGRSMDLNSGFMMLISVAALSWFGKEFSDSSMSIMRIYFGSLSYVPEPSDQWFSFLGAQVLKQTLDLLWPILLVLLLAGLVINLLQVGLNFTTKPLEFDLGKVFSWKAVTGLFGKQAWVELLKGVAKMALVGWVAYDCIQDRYEDLLMSVDMEFQSFVWLLLDVSFEMLWKVALLLLILGIADWTYQKRKNHNELKMTKEEAKEETRNSMGDPKMVAARKQAMAKMHRQFMMKEVPKATVVITNPTFIAIAIRYDRSVDQVPVVVAKGKRLIAQKIRDLAVENGIPIVENKPLARGMFDFVQPGEPIPAEFFNGVAEILAYVFNLEQRKAVME